jgi:hypothetical protein
LRGSPFDVKIAFYHEGINSAREKHVVPRHHRRPDILKTAQKLSSAVRAVAAIGCTAAILLGHSSNALAAPPRPETPAPSKAAVKPAVQPAAASPVPAPAAPSGPQNETERRRAAVLKSLVMLQKGAASFSKLNGNSCQSCHHQMLPVMTLAVARERGLPVDEAQARAEHAGLDKMVGGAEAMLAPTRTDPAAQKSMDTADTPLMLGYILTGFAREKRPADANTNAMAAYLLRAQRTNGSFPAYSTRVPMEGSTFTSTALVVRALQAYTPQTEADAAKTVIARAQTWLATTPPKTNEDRTFRLLGLRWSGRMTPPFSAPPPTCSTRRTTTAAGPNCPANSVQRRLRHRASPRRASPREATSAPTNRPGRRASTT